MAKLSNTAQVDSKGLLSVATITRAYGAVYRQNMTLDLVALGIKPKSWIWTLLRVLEADSAVAPIAGKPMREMFSVITRLALSLDGNRLLNKAAKRTTATDIRRVFQLSEELAADSDAKFFERGQQALRALFYARAHTVGFAEPMEPRRVRFTPTHRWPRGKPRPLISDLHDITDPKANLPVGALAATTVKQVTTAVKERTEYDLERIRSACIADMTAAAALRHRAKELRSMPVSSEHLSHIRKQVMVSKTARRVFARHGITAEIALNGVLKLIHAEELATSRSAFVHYHIPLSKEVRAVFLDGIAAFKSDRLLEIEYRAIVEELFAAFHLLQTYLGWNWGSVSSLQADHVDLSTPGVVVLQSFKYKTDDDTPICSIDLSEPGVQMAIEVLLWNRQQLVKCGFLGRSEQGLWATRPGYLGNQRAGYFHPLNRLNDFIQRHALPRYTLEQIRTQVLFSVSLKKGGIEAARLQGGHRSYGATQRYVGNIVQDRISSALNLEFSKRLDAEVVYLYRGGTTNAPEIALLKPIGDGSSCVDPATPPPNRSKTQGNCSAEACHTDGGCPNRRIVVDDCRVEEALRLNLHYTQNWQRLMHANPERFAAYTLPQVVFNAALLLALQRGPYAARVMQLSVKIGMS